MQFEDELLRDYPEIYHANRNKAVEAAAGKPVWAVSGGGVGAWAEQKEVLNMKIDPSEI